MALLHVVVGDPSPRGLAVIDLVLTYFTCDLERDGVFRRNDRPLP